MAIMTIESRNQDLSFVLAKNPESGITTRKIREGVGYGWFAPKTEVPTYALYFQDGADCESFKQGQYDMLGKNKFSNSLAFIGLLNEFLRSARNGEYADADVEAWQRLSLKQVMVYGDSMLRHLTNNISGIFIEVTELSDSLYEIDFSGHCTIQKLVEIAYICLIFLTPKKSLEGLKIDDAWTDKYIDIIDKYEMPYFIRYLFNRNFLYARELFNNYGNKLSTDTIQIKFGDTQRQRQDFVRGFITGCRPIIDVGCGEGNYIAELRKKTAMGYHAVDVDEQELAKAKGMAKKQRIDESEIQFYRDIENVGDLGTAAEIICTEVIEHMPLVEAEALVSKLLSRDFSTLVITTPNRTFNKHYHLDGGFRHDDHSWEKTTEEFNEWLSGLVNSRSDAADYSIEFDSVGDVVDGEATSSGAVIKRIDSKPLAIVTVGPSAGGKSTFASQMLDSGLLWKELNRDNIRFGVNKPKDWNQYEFSRKNEAEVTQRWETRLKKAIKSKANIIASDTNLNLYRRKALIERLEKAGYQVLVKHFSAPFAELLKRDRTRQGGVGYEVLLSQYTQYRREMLGLEGPVAKIDGAAEIYICDLDGTLFDSEGNRDPFDMTKVLGDKPIAHVCAMVRALITAGYTVKFFSGRHDCHAESLEALRTHVHSDILSEDLTIRKENDCRPDHVVKMEMFNEQVKGKLNVAAVIDDRKQVIEECWHILGLNVINVGKAHVRF